MTELKFNRLGGSDLLLTGIFFGESTQTIDYIDESVKTA